MTELILQSYRALGLEPGASVVLVKLVYRQLIKEWHPDRFHGDQEKSKQANEKLKEIIPAYENLIAYHNGNPPKNTFRRNQRSSQPEASKPKDSEAQFQEGLNCKSAHAFERAAYWFSLSANQGHVNAMFELGNLFYDGEGVAADRSEAAKWYRMAGENGHSGAQYKLGLMREYGDGVTVFSPEALEWYLKAAEQNHAEAQLAAGRLYRSIRPGIKNDLRKAAFWFRRAAEHGLTEAKFELGQLFEWGGEQIEKDFVEAASWYRRAAESGHEHAGFELARFYEEGLGVLKNEREADRWLRRFDWAGRLRKEAKAGMGTSQASLAHMYDTGIGVEQDLAEAFKWHQKAAAWGFPGNQVRLAEFYATGHGTPRNLVEAIKWFTIANRTYKQSNKPLFETIAAEMSEQDIKTAKRKASRFVPSFMRRTKSHHQ